MAGGIDNSLVCHTTLRHRCSWSSSRLYASCVQVCGFGSDAARTDPRGVEGDHREVANLWKECSTRSMAWEPEANFRQKRVTTPTARCTLLLPSLASVAAASQTSSVSRLLFPLAVWVTLSTFRHTCVTITHRTKVMSFSLASFLVAALECSGAPKVKS